MTYYQMRKEAAREEAIRWQQEFDRKRYTWSEIRDWVWHFHKIGKRFGLLKEFRENGII